MNATLAKATRREIRRAVGPQAVEAIEAHETGLRLHAVSLTNVGKTADLALARANDCDARLLRLPEQMRRDARADHAERYRTFWSRLRWLLTGRTDG